MSRFYSLFIPCQLQILGLSLKNIFIVYSYENELFIEVLDSGIGIEKKNLEILFDEFAQAENMMQKKHKGTGLGLALCKKMAQLLDGDVTLNSEGLGKGARAIIKLSF